MLDEVRIWNRARTHEEIQSTVTRTHVKPGEMRTGFDFELKPHPIPDIPEPGEEPTRIRHEDEDDEDEDEGFVTA